MGKQTLKYKPVIRDEVEDIIRNSDRGFCLICVSFFEYRLIFNLALWLQDVADKIYFKVLLFQKIT